MRIVAVARTLNEAAHIADYCANHSWCDWILVADGGSTDTTIEIARHFPNVLIRQFKHYISLDDGSFMNPEPAHVNFLLDWAGETQADWVIHCGVDTWPNTKLKQRARQILQQAIDEDRDGVMATLLYQWGETRYFPKISEAGPLVWAWRPDRLDAHCDESHTTFFDCVMPTPERDRCLIIEPPLVCLHDYQPHKKAARYAAWGHPQIPIENGIYWPPEALPEWAK